jgi:hypothetical protein
MEQSNVSQFKYFVLLKKAYQEGDDIYIEGVASGTMEDRDKERMSPAVLQAFVDVIKGIGLPLTDAHEQDGILMEIGDVVDAKILDDEESSLFIKAKLDSDNPKTPYLLKQITKGKKYAFSVEGWIKQAKEVYSERLQSFVTEFQELIPKAISVTTRPSYIPSFLEVVSKSYQKGLKQASESYTDYPESASNNAKKVIDWKEEHGDEVKGMTVVGWTRARQLANREPLSRDTIARMSAFMRHKDNSEVAEEYKDTPWKDRGYVAWLGWGGTSGINWAQKKLAQIDRKATKNASALDNDTYNDTNTAVEDTKIKTETTVDTSENAKDTTQEALTIEETTEEVTTGTSTTTENVETVATETPSEKVEKAEKEPDAVAVMAGRMDKMESVMKAMCKKVGIDYESGKEAKKENKKSEKSEKETEGVLTKSIIESILESKLSSVSESIEALTNVAKSLHDDIEAVKDLPLQKKSQNVRIIEKDFDARQKPWEDMSLPYDERQRAKWEASKRGEI